MVKIDYSQYVDALIKDIQNLVQIPSVRDLDQASEEAPYGPAIAQAVEWLEEKAQADGFQTENHQGHVLTIEPKNNGQGQRVEIACHLDVVDVAEGWEDDPFSGKIVDNRLYGRGSDDMKRADMLVYYALKIIRDYHIPLKNQLVWVYGTDEECNMDDMKYFRQLAPEPSFAFTPDGDFPLSIGEKGALTWTISGQWPADSLVHSLKGGEGANVVASFCQIALKANNPEAAETYCRAKGWPAKVVSDSELVVIQVKGKAAHSSVPELGANAIVRALDIAANAYGDHYASQLLDCIGSSDGSGLGIDSATEKMGALTFNLGTLVLDGKGAYQMEVDIRYPDVWTSDQLYDQVKTHFPEAQFETTFDVPWTLVDAKRPAIQTLLNQFEEVFPSEDQAPAVSGGVTYSKFIPNCVGFGAAMADDPTVAHQANEWIDLGNLADLLRLYTQVIIELGQMEDL
ncbi:MULTISPECIES: Sapep family Mn(2+)-dependent dipeptidase [Aerococcus]|uniref:Sapep family Mn(2+)-dependent dipeptidase n=1 Tax=Aerococcus urinae (strain CCUG 59500 / ACS-120-V-Col10a) TaxID=2976812 RepID=UPI000200F0D2|nr:Sapep family Mn(2+)-dependent dipeptidase [Aerococcus sp. Group 1]AEA01795.1 dipeptidase PepV [Aerococcus sp. Group 1]MCY3030124.1 Sapep family Mn(2+)-dependent dipeptidase [Aerococcus sp. Group 1]MCY3054437.1 Sapep family Mn(2+)-dependent dipeptidase [Aerococcus sp. Group 1]MCY3056167.1 Sapep family Mn(2+)-dependent dipeptidase [Aerococcus sp. Group 1]MCY3061078.1 Sapep family Mn(2+)-dependent dipeptidase [Aerococcus sp. Group 1]